MGSRRSWGLTLCAVLTASSIVVPARATQLDASDDPTVTGPLSVQDRRCARHHKKRDGLIVVRAKTCLLTYFLDYRNDNDEAYDHGAAWLQTTVTPTRGWCVTRVGPSFVISGSTIVGDSRTPGRTIRTARRRSVRARVVVDGQGAAPTRGYVEQDFELAPKVLKRASLRETSSGDHRMRLTWTGDSRRKLAFVLGAELSFIRSQPPRLSPSLRYRATRSASC